MSGRRRLVRGDIHQGAGHNTSRGVDAAHRPVAIAIRDPQRAEARQRNGVTVAAAEAIAMHAAANRHRPEDQRDDPEKCSPWTPAPDGDRPVEDRLEGV
jgi:hypothetical protein